MTNTTNNIENGNFNKQKNYLKVASDPKESTAENKKKNVKRLAGAISHSLRVEGEVDVRAVGTSAIGKATKALAIAKKYIENTHDLVLSYSPAFLNVHIDENPMTGICFCAFSQTKEKNINIEDIKDVLMVKSDPLDIDKEEKKNRARKLAGAISHRIEEKGHCVIRCFGNASIAKACKSLAIARGFIATKGPDLYCWNEFITADIGGEKKTGMAFYVFTNET